MFDIWMRLLKNVPGSVLWLIADNKWAKENLRKEASARGIDPQRLVYAPRLQLDEHLALIEEAKRRVDRVADELGGKLGLASEWEGDHLRVHGKGVSGRILVSDDSVEVHVHVGFAMMLMREPIRSAIEGSIDEYIA